MTGFELIEKLVKQGRMILVRTNQLDRPETPIERDASVTFLTLIAAWERYKNSTREDAASQAAAHAAALGRKVTWAVAELMRTAGQLRECGHAAAALHLHVLAETLLDMPDDALRPIPELCDPPGAAGPWSAN